MKRQTVWLIVGVVVAYLAWKHFQGQGVVGMNGAKGGKGSKQPASQMG